jgi:quercetin dioxygenase-like cupin family protein
MRSWSLNEIDVHPQAPEVLVSTDEGRAIAIDLPAGEKLGEHQVHERAWLIVVKGHIEIAQPDGAWASGGPGLLVEFGPNERHEISATEDSRVLLLLSPWPGEGHPSNRD